MEDLVKGMCDKYGGDKFVCRLAVFLHDVGLVYMRKDKSSEGHEDRSVRYARKILEKYDISEEVCAEVVNCIEFTKKRC